MKQLWYWIGWVGMCLAAAQAGEVVWLSTLDLTKMRQGWGQAQVDRAIREGPLSVGGHRFDRGVGTHAKSVLWVDLEGGTERFLAQFGVDDAAGNPKASITAQVIGDGRVLWRSPVMRPGQPAVPVDVALRGVRRLALLVGDAGDGIEYDHADWAEARFLVTGTAPRAADPPAEEVVLLTPPPGPAPRINGARVHGCRPGNPFLYRIPATGKRPMQFSAGGMPKGLQLDPETGILTGVAPARGEYRVTLEAANAWGKDRIRFRIVSGELLALTPPMGWNHWYMHYDRVTDAMLRQAADVMVASGMADVGYAYVNIDDCWMNAPKQSDPLRVGPLRDDRGNLIPNRHFPDMKALTDYIHARGLKAGIYTSPGPLTCAGFAGSHGHEAQDARQFAEWGFDFLKYDWCSYDRVVKGDHSVPTLQRPYRQMGEQLRQQPRDIVFNLCQYGMGSVWEWGAAVGGHCWRTAGDLGFELDRIFEVALKNAEHRAFSRPGSWNDPDYIQIGRIGNARGSGEPMACPLSASEQYAFMSLWCLMAAPLVYSGDMNHLDALTLNVLCNAEVIEVDQDPLGESAEVLPAGEETFVMVKRLEDGSRAVGLFNRSEVEQRVSVRWADLGLKGPQRVRDLWRQQELGRFASEYGARVPRHGGVLVRVWRSR